MLGTFGFYADSALTTPLRGNLLLTVDSPGESATVSVYFGSPNAKEQAKSVGGGPVMISTPSQNVSLYLAPNGSLVQSLEIGETLSGGVDHAIHIGVTVAGVVDFDSSVIASQLEVTTL